MKADPPIFELEEDITTHCITASSFPAGVQKAHEMVHSLFDLSTYRRSFGISYPIGNNEIRYHAAVEALPSDEVMHPELDTFYIKKGKYAFVDIPNFMANVPEIGATFHQLLQHPHLDPSGYCLEWYLSDQDLRCMVPLTENTL